MLKTLTKSVTGRWTEESNDIYLHYICESSKITLIVINLKIIIKVTIKIQICSSHTGTNVFPVFTLGLYSLMLVSKSVSE